MEKFGDCTKNSRGVFFTIGAHTEKAPTSSNLVKKSRSGKCLKWENMYGP